MKVLCTSVFLAGLLTAMASRPRLGAREAPLECHGVSRNNWAVHKPSLFPAIEDFCNRRSDLIEYYDGTVDHVRLSADNIFHHSTEYIKPNPGECRDALSAIVNDCDLDPINNPHDYAFGGNNLRPDGWLFSLQPLAEQAPDAACDISVNSPFRTLVEIRGKNLPDARLGPDGIHLKERLEKCGRMNKWKFQYTPSDVKFHWYARCTLPINTKECVANAVRDLGSPTVGNC